MKMVGALPMKIAVSIPDELFTRAEKLARSTARSRSRFYQDAIAEYLVRHEPGEVTEAMNRALAGIDQAEDRPWLDAVARQMILESDW